ncbi:MAG: serine hydrolase domain-containing protein, partial [Thermoleophilaceae bacterium]
MRSTIQVVAVAVGVLGCERDRALQASGAPAAGDQRQAAVERRLQPPVRIARDSARDAAAGWTIGERLSHYRVPGVSVAVIDSGRVDWARGYGLSWGAHASTLDSVTAATLFQAASISKPVAAVAALRLVDQGRLALDSNVNRYLSSWSLPENKLSRARPVTLRLVLSHGAGLTVHGFEGYAAGAPVPTLPQLLDGAPPANSAAVRVDLAPGTTWRYSGGGYALLQQLLEDATGRAFPLLAHELVFAPFGMSVSTFAQPLPDSLGGRAAAGYRPDGSALPGRWHTYPELAAAGLWTTATDLVRFALGISRAANGDSTVLRPATARAMLSPQVGAWGLGVAVRGEGRAVHWSHSGANEGYRALLVAFPATGQGLAVMTNSDAGAALAQEIVRAVAEVYRWPALRARTIATVALSRERLASYAGRYALGEQPGLALKIALLNPPSDPAALTLR